MNSPDLKYQIETAEVDNGGMTITWGDGHSSFFHAIWLRHQCTCASCGTPINAVRGIRLHRPSTGAGLDTAYRFHTVSA